MEKLHIEKDTIQETLVIPLYARKLCTELYPYLFKDKSAQEIMSRLDYDFSEFIKQSDGIVQRYGALEIAMRQNNLAAEVMSYLEKNPEAAVVNMGCGLDCTGENCDNGKCRIYNLDRPDVIEVRNKLIPPADRAENIGCDINDISWFNKIDADKGAVFFASGVFYYFTSEEIEKLFNSMAEKFKGGKLVFDTGGKTSLKMMLKTFVKQAGIKNIDAYFHVDSIEKDIKPWLKNAKASSKGYMTGYTDINELPVSGLFRAMAKFGDKKLHLSIMRIDFDA